MYISSFTDLNRRKSNPTFDNLLKDTLCSFVRSQVLFVAIRLDLFTRIDQSPRRSLSLKQILNLNIPLSMISYLVYLRLIERCPNSSDYQCTHVTKNYLISTGQNYVGLGIGVWDYRRQYKFFLRLKDTLQFGRRVSEDDDTQANLWTIFEQKQDPMIYFARIMSSFTRCTIDELCDHLNFSIYSTLLDVGGSLGELSRTMVERNPHLKALSLDLPKVTTYALESLTQHPNIKYIPGDFFDDSWPKEIIQQWKSIDLVTLKYILHDWSLERRSYLVKKIYRLLKYKTDNFGGLGALIIIEKMIDTKRENITALLTSVSMAIECGDGIGYDGTQDEYRKLLSEAGFQRIQLISLMGPMVALLAHVV